MSSRRTFISGAASLATASALAGCGRNVADSYGATVAAQRAFLADNPDMHEFIRFATLAPNSHNTQPWRFGVARNAIIIMPDISRRTPAVDPDDHHLFVSLGCAAENLGLAAKARSRAGEIAFNPERAVGIDVDMTPTRVVADALHLAIPQLQSTRSDYDGRPVAAADLTLLEAAARTEGVSITLITDSARILAIRDFVIRGNSAQMDDPAFVRELKHWIRYSASQAVTSGDGLFSRSSGNPALPGWLGSWMFDFVFTKSAENKKYDSQIRSSAGIAVFVGDRDDKEHWVKVGRSFQRFALQATALGIRHAHINQPMEVPAIRSEFAAWLGIGKTRPDLVVRFGYAPPMPMSLRRPVSDVISPGL
jgi:hypothetical protein